MSWQLTSVLIVCAALVVALFWVERTRPSSKMVALVAALAALAVAGRVVLSPLPNVQATTDVTLLAGYVMGAGPGFLIGSVAALTSNVFLGQGPWTPWEMLGWGAAGALGAVLARVTLRRMGRFPLSLSCAVVGLLYGAWMDLSVLFMFAGERSADGYLVVATTSLPFNIAHAVGNFVFCMVFGPSFVRLLNRFRLRTQVKWEEATRRVATPVTLACLVLLPLILVPIATSFARGPGDAADYLRKTQNEDGGWGGSPKQASSELITNWATLGLEAAGNDPRRLGRGGKTPIDFMRARAQRISGVAELERAILVLGGAGLNPRRFAGRNLVRELERKQRSDGSFRGWSPDTAFGVMALRAGGRSARARPVRRGMRWLLQQQNRDGGFSNHGRGGASDVDDTGAVLQGLAAGGRRSGRVVVHAVAYLKRAQNPDGGLGQFGNADSNAQSTSWAIQGLVAARRNPARIRARRGGRSVLGYLASLQQANGSFRYSRTSEQTPVWVTAQALAALKQRAFPLVHSTSARAHDRTTTARVRVTARASSKHRESTKRRLANARSSSWPAAVGSLAGTVGTEGGAVARSGAAATGIAAAALRD